MNFDTVEDIAEAISERMHDPELGALLGDRWFIRFFSNIGSWCRQGKPLTTEQAKIVLKVTKKVKPFFVDLGVDPQVFHDLVARPAYRRPPTLSSVLPREVRYLGDGLLGFRFKRDDTIIDAIKLMRADALTTPHRIEWDRTTRMWFVGLCSDTVEGIEQIIMKHRFHFDDSVAQAITDTYESGRGKTIFRVDAEGILHVEVNDNDLMAAWVTNSLGGVPQ